MNLNEPIYKKLISYQRNGLEEQVHLGLILHINKSGVIKSIGNDNNYKFYHRSCMKPLQISPIIDLEADIKYNISQQELAVCAASHTGDLIHQENVYSILKKINCTPNDLLCKPHKPLSEKEQKRLLLNHLEPINIHNNCSGKHAAMLAICKSKNFPIENYNKLEHPLSEYIINKICTLCEVSKNDIVISKDGCGLPVIATSLFCLGKGFLNLFTNSKYKRLTESIQKFPYHMGGEKRLDSEIINASNNLIAKVGACGLCVVVNIEKEECIIVKIADSNMEARTIATIDALIQLKWLNNNQISSSQINNIYKKEIKTQYNDVIGNITSTFNLN